MVHRIVIDNYRPTLEQELDKFPEFKKAFEIVENELDTKIADLERRQGLRN